MEEKKTKQFCISACQQLSPDWVCCSPFGVHICRWTLSSAAIYSHYLPVCRFKLTPSLHCDALPWYRFCAHSFLRFSLVSSRVWDPAERGEGRKEGGMEKKEKLLTPVAPCHWRELRKGMVKLNPNTFQWQISAHRHTASLSSTRKDGKNWGVEKKKRTPYVHFDGVPCRSLCRDITKTRGSNTLYVCCCQTDGALAVAVDKDVHPQLWGEPRGRQQDLSTHTRLTCNTTLTWKLTGLCQKKKKKTGWHQTPMCSVNWELSLLPNSSCRGSH